MFDERITAERDVQSASSRENGPPRIRFQALSRKCLC
jgi:hypothetical protein